MSGVDRAPIMKRSRNCPRAARSLGSGAPAPPPDWERVRIADGRIGYMHGGLLASAGGTPFVYEFDAHAWFHKERDRLPTGVPSFDHYPATERFCGRPAAVDFDSMPGSRRFVTRIREGAASGPNFAGHLTLIGWGCGTACQSVAMVDARTGRILGAFGTSTGSLYTPNSRLLVVDLDGTDPDCVTCGELGFHIWTGRALERVGDSPPLHLIDRLD